MKLYIYFPILFKYSSPGLKQPHCFVVEPIYGSITHYYRVIPKLSCDSHLDPQSMKLHIWLGPYNLLNYSNIISVQSIHLSSPSIKGHTRLAPLRSISHHAAATRSSVSHPDASRLLCNISRDILDNFTMTRSNWPLSSHACR